MVYQTHNGDHMKDETSQNECIELVEVQEEDGHGLDISALCAHPTREDEIQMFENERKYVKTDTKVIQEGYFKE